MTNLLRSERGIALPLVVMVMLVLSVSVIGIVQYTAANSRNASLTKERQNAKGLAEDGFNRAAAILHKLVTDAEADGTPYHLVSLPPSSVPSAELPDGHAISWEQVGPPQGTDIQTRWTLRGTGTVPNPSGPGGAPITRRVQGTLYLQVESTASEVAWRGVFAAEQGNRPLISDDKAMIDTPLYIKEGYSSYSATGVGTGPLPIVISAGKILTDDFRVYGRLAVTGAVNVSSIGASARPGASFKVDFPAPMTRDPFRVGTFRVKDGCALSTSGPFLESTCQQTSLTGGPTQRFWLPCPSGLCTSTTVDSPAYSNNVPNQEKPRSDLPKAYNDILPGNNARGHRCYANSESQLKEFNDEVSKDFGTGVGRPGNGFPGSSRIMDKNTTRNRDTGIFDLMPRYPYDCRVKDAAGVEMGKLKWTPGPNASTPGTLEISGDIYLDGDVVLGNSTTTSSTHGWGEVRGMGRVYVTGTVTLKGDYAGLCGVADTLANRDEYEVLGSPDARGRCLNGRIGDPVPAPTPAGPGAEIWDPATTPDMIWLIVGFASSISTVHAQDAFQFQGNIYAGCQRTTPSGLTDSLCPSPSEPPRSGLLVQNNATIKGPVIVDSVEVKNSGMIAGWTPLTDLGESGLEVESIALTLLPGSWRG